jgi:error-prone DNA polymerase
VESGGIPGAQHAALSRLEPWTFFDTAIEVALIYPVRSSAAPVHPYLCCLRRDDPVIYPHPSQEPIVRKTLGVTLFQEQLMHIAVVAAGMDRWRPTGRAMGPSDPRRGCRH